MKSRSQTGFSLIELMIALVIGLVILAGVSAVFISQRQMNKGVDVQGLIQNSENAISAILAPAIEGAGFAGCATLANTKTIINNPAALPYNIKPIYGYDAVNTAAGGTVNIAADNTANDASSSDWSPTLDSSFTSPTAYVEKGSDVLIVLGPVPGIAPVPVTAFNLVSTSLTLQAGGAAQLASLNPSPLQTNSIGAISDCAQAHVFQISAISANGATISFSPNATGSIPGNSTTPLFAYLPGAQFIPMQQVAFFVGQGSGGQSSLFQMVMINGAWGPTQELIPGVENMQILYGVGNNGVTTQWLPANQVTNWNIVNSVQLAFLLVGGTGANTAGVSQAGGVSLNGCSGWSLLGTCVTVPKDTQVRHVYTTTIAVRNTSHE